VVKAFKLFRIKHQQRLQSGPSGESISSSSVLDPQKKRSAAVTFEIFRIKRSVAVAFEISRRKYSAAVAFEIFRRKHLAAVAFEISRRNRLAAVASKTFTR
jgi:hypothetical protein